MDKVKCVQPCFHDIFPHPEHSLQPECAVLGAQGGPHFLGCAHRRAQDLLPCHCSAEWSLYIKDVPLVLDTDGRDLLSEYNQRHNSQES